MKATAQRKPLGDALGWVANVVRPNPVAPMLVGVHIEADKEADALVLRTTDYDAWLTADVPATVIKGGTTVIGAHRLRDLVNAMGADDVRLALDGRGLTVESGRASYTLPTVDADTWPQAPESGETLLTINAEVLRDAWKRTAFACNPDYEREDLRGVQMIIAPDSLTLAATDSYVMSVARLPIQTGTTEAWKAILPVRAMTDALKGLSDLITVAHSPGLGTLTLGSPDREIGLRLLASERMIDIERLVSRYGGIPVEIDTADLLAALKRAEIGAPTVKSGTRHVRITADAGEVSVVPVGDDVTGGDRLDGLLASPVAGRFDVDRLRAGLVALDAKRVVITLPEKGGGSIPASLITEAGTVDPFHRVLVQGVKESA